MDPSHIITKSLQNLLLQHVNLHASSSHTLPYQSKSLPNIFIASNHESCVTCKILDQEIVKKHPKPKILQKTWDKVKTVIHNTTSHSNRRGSLKNKLDKPSSSRSSFVSSAPCTPIQKATFEFDNPPSPNEISFSYNDPMYNNNTGNLIQTTENDCTEAEETDKIQSNYAKLQKRLSVELHQRMSEYKQPDPKHTTDNLSDDFKKKLQQWEMWKLSTGKVTYTDEELKQILPEDFSKKLHEWECIKTSGVSPHGHHSSGVSQHGVGASSPETPACSSGKNKLLRKKKNSDSSRQKELAWLEKQLEKIEAEKKRLEREMKKYIEREARLEKMKEALQNTNSNEVWIRTPTAKFKVEKLTEKFTKKLYEWEEKQGIQSESSTMALLHPKYFGPPPTEEESEQIERLPSIEDEFKFHDATYDEDEEEIDDIPVFSFRESDSRQDDDCDEIECQKPLKHELEERQISSSSSDFEEATDSFATHDKGNSGASNTDSDFYRAEFPCSRRRSSEAISTPLSARSPSLSAFTSDDEGEMCGLLKTVCEENETINVLKDAESQTEVIFKAKPIHVDDEEGNEESLGDEFQTGIFVPTKRTIFTPILSDETDSDKVVLIEQELKSPFLVKNLVQNSPNESNIILHHEDNKLSFDNENQSKSPIYRSTPPRIVEVIHKRKQYSNTFPNQYQEDQPQTPTTQRSFPKMGKIPIWCSPLGSRKTLGGSGVSTSSIGISDLSPQYHRSHSISSDFPSGHFMMETDLERVQGFEVSPARVVCTSASTSQIPTITPRLYRRNTSGAVIEESGLVGANVQTGQRHPAILLPTRSSSFRFRRDSEQDNNMTLRASNASKYGQQHSETSKGLYSQFRHRVGSVVTKSQSTGSIRSKLGKAFSYLTSHKLTKDRDHQNHSIPVPNQVVEGRAGNPNESEQESSSSGNKEVEPSTSKKHS